MLHLPNCTYIELYHADDLDWLEIHAPKLCNLNLGSCYTLKHLRLHPQEGSPCTVYLVDEVGQQPLQHLQQHPRVGSECICFQNEIDGDDDAERFNEVHGGYPAPHMGGTDELMVANLFQTVVGHYIAEVDDDVYPHERERLWVTS